MGFNYQAYREANKIELTLVQRTTVETRDEKGKTIEKFDRKSPVDTFVAYTNQDFDLGVSFNIAEGFFDQAIAEVNDKLPLISKGASMIQNHMNNQNWKDAMQIVKGLGLISYSKHGNYKGTDVLKIPVTCYLSVVNGTYKSDVLDNLRKFITWFIPSRGILNGNEELNRLSGTIASAGEEFSQGLKQKFGDDSLLAEISKSLANAASSAIDAAKDELGDIYSLEMPMAFDGKHFVNFKWGRLSLSDVVVKNFSIRVPTIMTANGQPDTYEIKFNVETSHVVDTSMLENLYNIQ